MATPVSIKASRPLRRHAPAWPAPRRAAVAWAAATLLAAPTAQALDIFTGNAPVLVGAWFNGSFTEVVEFQFALDWAGWCNAHIGSQCSRHRYWNAAGNWDQGSVPGAGSDVRIEAGHTVRIGQYNSLYQGQLPGVAAAAVLTGTGRVELYGLLRVGNASFADLHNDRDTNGTLQTSGLSSITLLSSGAGRFLGPGGTTRVQAFTPSSARGLFEPVVGAGHTFEFTGSNLAPASATGPAAGPASAHTAALATPAPSAQASAGLNVQLHPTARFINSGSLHLGGGAVGLQGSATFAELPVFINQGQLLGNGTVSGVKFENQGTVTLDAGLALALGSWGEHSGQFNAGAGSTLSFTGLGSAGHAFLPGSQVQSGGAVNFGRGNHRVQGGFSAASVDSRGGGALVFDGARPTLGNLALHNGSTLALRTADGAAIQTLLIASDISHVDVNSGAALDLNALQLVQGNLIARTPVNISGPVTWTHGWLTGAGPVTVADTGSWQLLAGDRGLRSPVINHANLSWEGGQFTEWTGRFTHQAGAQFDILGDFNSAGGVGGQLVNHGTVSKLGGSGRSQLAMGFDTGGGTVRSLSGTLALTGGGTHTDASFNASPGAAIELAGGTTFAGAVNVSGALHLTGGDFTLLRGTAYAHAAGNRFEVAKLNIQPLAQLSVADTVRIGGHASNLGSLQPAGHVQIQGDLLQQGTLDLLPGKSLYVQGSLNNHRALVVQDAELNAGVLVNHDRIDVRGSSTLTVGRLDNRATLVLGPANGFPGLRAYLYDGSNSGTLRVDGGSVDVSAYALTNTGQIRNEGYWAASTSFAQTAGGRFDNAGQLTLDGDTTLFETSSIHNSGSLVQQGGTLAVHVGAEISGAGSFVQTAGTSDIGGRLQAGGVIHIQGGLLKGTGTLAGDLFIEPAAQWTPGNGIGTMTVLGRADAHGGLVLEIDSRSQFDRLVVSGDFNARATAIDLIFGPGYQPQDRDIDTIDWLSSGGGTPQVSTAVLNVSGLPAQWQATLAPNGQIQLGYSLAQQIPLSGNHAIGSSDVYFNAIGSNTGLSPILGQLDNAGYLHNRSGASAIITLLNNAAGATLVNRGELSATTLDNAGQLTNHPGGVLQVGGLSNRGSVVNEGSAWLYGDLLNEAGGTISQRGTLQVNGQVQNFGALQVQGVMTGMHAFHNRGDLHILAGGSVAAGPGGYFWHSYAELRVDGLLQADEIRIFGGRLSGNGRLQSASLTIASDIDPGNSVGLLTLDGNLTADGNVHLEIASASDFDRLVVLGNAQFNGGLIFQLLGDYRPVLGDSFALLSVSGSLSGGAFNHWRFERPDGFGGWVLWADAQGIHDPGVPADWRAAFSQGTVSITAVPEPGPAALWAAGLGAMAWLARRRGAARPSAQSVAARAASWSVAMPQPWWKPICSWAARSSAVQCMARAV